MRGMVQHGGGSGQPLASVRPGRDLHHAACDGAVRGQLLKYKQAIDDKRTCCVSFASMAFHAIETTQGVALG